MKVNTFTLIKSGFACITSDNPQYSYHLSHFIFLTCFYFISILYKSQAFLALSFYIFTMDIVILFTAGACHLLQFLLAAHLAVFVFFLLN